MKRLWCWLTGHDERSDWFFSLGGKRRRPVFFTWCGRCGASIAERRARQRDLKGIYPYVSKRWQR